MSDTPDRDDAASSLRHGADFPYDAPDAWWEGDTSVPPPPARDWAHAAARGVLADMGDRSGFDDALSRLDEDVRAEIVESLAAIIRKARESSP